jgi:hypothetical protein
LQLLYNAAQRSFAPAVTGADLARNRGAQVFIPLDDYTAILVYYNSTTSVYYCTTIIHRGAKLLRLGRDWRRTWCAAAAAPKSLYYYLLYYYTSLLLHYYHTTILYDLLLYFTDLDRCLTTYDYRHIVVSLYY